MENKSSVEFLNQPKLSGHDVDKELDQARIYLIQKIEEFICGSKMFNNETVSVSFFHTGVSSLVCLLESKSNKYILKMKLRQSNIDMESFFLKKWEDIGIKVPHIYEIGYIEEYNYILMEYIEKDILTKVYSTDELISKNIFFEMGQILQKIHTLKTEGFGLWSSEDKAEYKIFEEWLLNDDWIQNQIKYTKENNLLPKEVFGSVDENLNKLIKYIKNNNQTTYCHFDFSPNNILVTEPITIFDPVCLNNHPYIDLAKSIIQSIANCKNNNIAEQIVKGYFELNNDSINREFLNTTLLFIACIKFPYWHKKKYTDTLSIVKDYLEKV